MPSKSLTFSMEEYKKLLNGRTFICLREFFQAIPENDLAIIIEEYQNSLKTGKLGGKLKQYCDIFDKQYKHKPWIFQTASDITFLCYEYFYHRNQEKNS